MLSEQAKEARREYNRNQKKQTPEAIEKNKLYHREWRRKNPDKVANYSKPHIPKSFFKAFNISEEDSEADFRLFDTPDFKLPKEQYSGKDQELWIVRLRNNNYSLREIATELNISHMKVSRVLKKIIGEK